MMHMHRRLHPKSFVLQLYLSLDQVNCDLLSLWRLNGRVARGLTYAKFRFSSPPCTQTYEMVGVRAHRVADDLGIAFWHQFVKETRYDTVKFFLKVKTLR